MASQITPALAALLNKVEGDFIVFAHMVPLRIIRVTAHRNFKTFRVEQLVLSNRNRLDPQGTWRTLSTHGGDTEALMLGPAMEAARTAQNNLAAKLKARTGR